MQTANIAKNVFGKIVLIYNKCNFLSLDRNCYANFYLTTMLDEQTMDTITTNIDVCILFKDVIYFASSDFTYNNVYQFPSLFLLVYFQLSIDRFDFKKEKNANISLAKLVL